MALRDLVYNGLGLTPSSGEEADQLEAIMRRLEGSSAALENGEIPFDRLRMAATESAADDAVMRDGSAVQGGKKFPDAAAPSTNPWRANLEPSPRMETAENRNMVVPQTAPIVQKAGKMPPPSSASPTMAPSRTAPAQPQAQGGSIPKAPEPDFWDRLGDFSRGYNTGGLVGAIADGFGNNRQRQAESANLTSQALVKAGVPPEMAAAAVRNPELMKTLLGAVVGKQLAPTQWQVDEIYDEKTGRKRKILRNPTNPTQFMPLGGEALGRDQGLNPTEQKTLNAAEDENIELESTVSQLKEARGLTDKLFTGWFSGLRGKIGTALPENSWLDADDWVDKNVIDRETSKSQQRWQSIMSPEAINAMSKALTGATTNFELEEFKKVMADPDVPTEQKNKIIENLIRKAERRMRLNNQRIEEMRGGGVRVNQEGAGAPQVTTTAPPSGPAAAMKPEEYGAAPPPAAPGPNLRGVPKEPPPNAKRAKDGNIYIPDPNNPGKFLRWKDD